jgi:allantoin racemase
MKICYQRVSPRNSAPPTQIAALERLLREAARPDTEFEIRCPDKLEDGVWSFHSGFNVNFIKQVKQAERDGFDGVIIDCFRDPGLQEARQICEIPVVAVAESSMLLAHLIAGKFAIVAFPTPSTRSYCEGLIDRYGFRGKAIVNPVRFMSYPESDLFRKIGQGEDPTYLVDNFMEVARGAIQDGAEIIIPGCTTTSMIHEHIREIKGTGVPVLSPVQAALKMVEVLVDIKEKIGFHISRASTYNIDSGMSALLINL